MPEDVTKGLTKSDLRDLVEFLSQQITPADPTKHYTPEASAMTPTPQSIHEAQVVEHASDGSLDGSSVSRVCASQTSVHAITTGIASPQSLQPLLDL